MASKDCRLFSTTTTSFALADAAHSYAIALHVKVNGSNETHGRDTFLLHAHADAMADRPLKAGAPKYHRPPHCLGTVPVSYSRSNV
jgi:hypothetical protein